VENDELLSVIVKESMKPSTTKVHVMRIYKEPYFSFQSKDEKYIGTVFANDLHPRHILYCVAESEKRTKEHKNEF